MIKDVGTLKREYQKIKESLICQVSDDDYRRLESHMPYILEMAQVENRSLSLYDINKQCFLVKVDRHIQLLGYGEEEMDVNDIGRYHTMVHPDDLPFMYDSEIQMFNFVRPLQGEEKKDYKLVYDFRVRNKSGEYIRFLHQLTLFELDRNGNSWILLVISDVISSHPTDELPRRFLINTKDKKICLFNEELGIGSELLTKREKEVLELIAQGLDSQDIADMLCVSVHTINNHRQNILSKTRTKNIAQAIAYLSCIGLI